MKNRYEIHGKDTIIFVDYKGQEFKTYISTVDLPLVKKARSWMARYEYSADSFYVVGSMLVTDKNGNPLKKQVSMHRLVMGFPEGMVVDHINHVRWDNRRENLQIVTLSQNSAKQPERKKEIPQGSGRSLVSLIFDDFLKDACLMMAAKNQMNLRDYIAMVMQKEINSELESLIKKVI